MKLLHSNHKIDYELDTKIFNNTIVNKTNDVIMKLVCLPISKKNYDIILEQTKDRLNVYLNINIDNYYNSNLKLDNNLIQILANNFNPTINNFNTNLPTTKTYKFYINDIIKHNNYYLDLSNQKVKKKLDDTDYKNLKINGYIVNGIKKIYFFKTTLEKYKKILVLCLNKRITKNLENVFSKLNVSYNGENTSEKWDCIINFENNTNISNYNYKTHIYVCENINNSNYKDIFKNFLGIDTINYNNYHNIAILNKFIIQNNQCKTIKIRKLSLTKYEKKFKVGLNTKHLESFYSYPGNYIFNKFLSKNEFKNAHGDITRQCSICLDTIELNKLTITDCNHVFCKDCLLKNMHISNKCPLCRQKIKKNSLSFVSKFKYINNKINYINSRLNFNKTLLILTSHYETINNLKVMYRKNGNILISHISKLNFIKDTYNEIILLDNDYEHFGFIIDIYLNNNKHAHITQLSYDVN